MIDFYDVEPGYVRYLQTFDRKVPNIEYTSNNKFIFGVVLEIHGKQYYAPISHFKEAQRTNLQIFNGQQAIATIRFCLMFPAPLFVLKKKKFKAMNEVDRKYVDLLRVEYDYCLSIENRIRQKAESVYRIGCNKKHKYNKNCCYFPALEQALVMYIAEHKTIEEVAMAKDPKSK